MDVIIATHRVNDISPIYYCHENCISQGYENSISVDGSNDSGLEKMNPVTIRLYDVNDNKVVTRFLDMCTSSSSTAAGIYSVVDSKLRATSVFKPMEHVHLSWCR